MTRSPRHQAGVTIVIALLFLLVITLVTIAAFMASTTNSVVTGNMMARQEAMSAAQSAIDQVISSDDFASHPENYAGRDYAIDIDGTPDTTEYTARIAPAPHCYRKRVVNADELDLANPSDAACAMTGAVQNPGIDSPVISTPGGGSMCTTTEWDVTSTVTDQRTGAQVVIHQGVGVRTLASDAANCN